MNFPGFNPSMFNSDQMSQASEMLNGMSDEQLKQYAKMMGMPQMDPQMLRNSMNMMKGMNKNQGEKPKGPTTNFPPNPPVSSNNQFKKQQSAAEPQPTTVSKYTKIENLKSQGNLHFKNGEYDKAGSAYFEAIIEIEEIRAGNKNFKDDELDNLEVSCRLNYANVKAKEEDYEVVLSQGKKALKIKENGKAYFRVGQALYYMKEYEESLKYLEKAKPLLVDNSASELYDKAKKALEERSGKNETEESKVNKEDPKVEEKVTGNKSGETNKEDIHTKKEEPQAYIKKEQKVEEEEKTKRAEPAETKLTKENPKVQEKEANKENLQTKTEESHTTEHEHVDEQKSKMKKKNAPKADNPVPKVEKNIETTKTSDAKEVDIEIKKSKSTSQNDTKPAQASDASQKTKEERENKSKEDLRNTADKLKGIDNAALRSILKKQTGMDIPDAQLEGIKRMMTPETLANFAKMEQSREHQHGPSCNHSHDHDHDHDHSHDHEHKHSSSIKNKKQETKLEKAQDMIEMMIKDPSLIKDLIKKLGENHPVSKVLKARKPETIVKILKVFKGILKVNGVFTPFTDVMKKYWQVFAAILVFYVILRVFGSK